MSSPPPSLWIWSLVWVIALGSRLIVLRLVPNAELDGYSYAEIIRDWTQRLSAGTFRPQNLFGFWLPVFQGVATICNLAIRDPLLAGRLVSTVAGAVACVLVFSISYKATGKISVAMGAFVLIVIDPLHLIYSAAAMTDVPFGCLILSVIWAVSARRWFLAGIFAGIAEGTRLEGWALLLGLPLLQFILERRVSPRLLVCLILPPLLWLVISRASSGDWLGYFTKRAIYQKHYLESYPSRHGFASADIGQDADYFFLGADPFVFMAMLWTAAVSIRSAWRRSFENDVIPLAIAIFSAAMLGLLGLAYLSKSQPVILPRYGLIYFTLGLPMLAWLAGSVLGPGKNRCLTALTVILCAGLPLRSFGRQLPIFAKVRKDFQSQQYIASKLDAAIGDALCFCDDPAVRILSHLPEDRFLRTEMMPGWARTSTAAFDQYLVSREAKVLVFFRTEDSLPVKLHPELGQNAADSVQGFQLLDVARSPFGPDIWLYRCTYP